eukprot:COSAG02_NODE_815_length_16868_cov_8.101258_4_plen_968_part_00
MSDAADLAGKLGFPEWKVAIALARRQGNANQAAEYLFTHGDKDEGFWRDQSPPGGAAAPVPAPMGYVAPGLAQPPDPWVHAGAGYVAPAPAPPHYFPAHAAGHLPAANAVPGQVQIRRNQPAVPYGNNNHHDHWGAPAPAPAPPPYIAPAPAPPPEPPLSSYTTTFVSTEPKTDHAGFQKWKGVQAWAGPDVQPAHKGLVGRAETGAMEGQRYWPGEGVIPKYPNGCQDRCFAGATPDSTCALGIFDGSGGENAEKVATVASGTVLQALQETRPPVDGSHHDWQTVLKQAFVRADTEVLRRPEHLWEDSAGCTGVVAVVDLALAQATVAHVGDSRALHFVPSAGTMSAVWQSNDHESTERAFGHRMRKNSPGHKPTPVPEVTTVPGVTDGSVFVLVSDGILNAYPTPEIAVTAMAGQLWQCILARRSPVRRAESRPLLEAALSEHMALTILREAEKAAAKHHEGNPRGFARDDMSVSLMYVQSLPEAEPDIGWPDRPVIGLPAPVVDPVLPPAGGHLPEAVPQAADQVATAPPPAEVIPAPAPALAPAPAPEPEPELVPPAASTPAAPAEVAAAAVEVAAAAAEPARDPPASESADAEQVEQARIAAEEAEQARIAAEQAEQARIAAEQAEQARLAAEAEQARLAAEEAEQARIAAEQAEQARIATEEAEQARIAAEEAEQERIAAEQAEQARIATEEAEQARLAAEEAEQERIAAEEAEQARIATEEAEQARLAAEEAEQERIATEEAEQARLAAEEAEQARLAAEEAEQARLAAEEADQEEQAEPPAAEQAEQVQSAAQEADQEEQDDHAVEPEPEPEQGLQAASPETATTIEYSQEVIGHFQALQTRAAVPVSDRGASIGEDLSKAAKYYDKVPALSHVGALTEPSSAAQPMEVDQHAVTRQYLDCLRYVMMVENILPQHEGWEGSDDQRRATKRKQLCAQKLDRLEPLVAQAFETEKQRMTPA